ILAFHFENVWIRQMEWFVNNNFFIFPINTIDTCRKPNISLIIIIIKYLKKHVPNIFFINHKRVSNKSGIYISYIFISASRDNIYNTCSFAALPSLAKMDRNESISSRMMKNSLFFT